MVYSVNNPPALSTDNIGGVQPKRWTYLSADAVATVAGAGYFTNGYSLGMDVNDIVEVTDTATPLVSDTRVTTVNATTGTATVSTGVTVGNT